MIRPLGTNPMLLASAGGSGYAVMSPAQLEARLRESNLFNTPLGLQEATALGAHVHTLSEINTSEFSDFVMTFAGVKEQALPESLKTYLVSDTFLEQSTARERRKDLANFIDYLDIMDEPEFRSKIVIFPTATAPLPEDMAERPPLLGGPFLPFEGVRGLEIGACNTGFHPKTLAKVRELFASGTEAEVIGPGISGFEDMSSLDGVAGRDPTDIREPLPQGFLTGEKADEPDEEE